MLAGNLSFLRRSAVGGMNANTGESAGGVAGYGEGMSGLVELHTAAETGGHEKLAEAEGVTMGLCLACACLVKFNRSSRCWRLLYPTYGP